MTDRSELKIKIEKAQERQSSRGGFSVTRAISDYTSENPLVAVAGGAVLGALIAFTLPAGRPNGTGRAAVNSKAKQAGKAAIGLGLNIVENTGQHRRERRKQEGTSGAGLLDDLIIFATSEIANAVRRRM